MSGLENLGNYIKRLRLTKGGRGRWSVRSVAESIGLSNAYLSQLESGHATNPSIDTLIKLSKAYNVPLDSFLKSIASGKTIEREDGNTLIPILFTYNDDETITENKNNPLQLTLPSSLIAHKSSFSLQSKTIKQFSGNFDTFKFSNMIFSKDKPIENKSVILYKRSEQYFIDDVIYDSERKEICFIDKYNNNSIMHKDESFEIIGTMILYFVFING